VRAPLSAITGAPRVGVLGGGQLGRMLALAAHRMGLQVRCYDDAPDACAGQLTELHTGSFTDHAALDEFARGLDVVTYEFENVPVAAAAHLAQRLPVHPAPTALQVCQDRLEEKTLFRELGVATPSFVRIDSQSDLDAALESIGTPSVLKTRRMGYDGKGQRVIRSRDDARGAFEAMGSVPMILEAFVPFRREVSIIAVRSRDGATAFYPLTENHHAGGVLRVSRAPAPETSASLNQQAQTIAGKLLDRMRYVGVLAVELFEHEGRLLANEMAPRAHNSGHWTIDACGASQFENQLRAVLGLPLGETTPGACAGMVNLVGGVPAMEAILKIPGARVHLYGKSPRPGRKVGHINVLAIDHAALNVKLREVIAACAGVGIGREDVPSDLR
jgi:5-(carboxyamino)imidazole ribonucleotide synthase